MNSLARFDPTLQVLSQMLTSPISQSWMTAAGERRYGVAQGVGGVKEKKLTMETSLGGYAFMTPSLTPAIVNPLDLHHDRIPTRRSMGIEDHPFYVLSERDRERDREREHERERDPRPSTTF